MLDNELVRESTPSQSATEADANYRQPPHNLSAEQAVLGSLLVNNQTIDKFGDFLREDHFYEPVHQRIFAAIIQLIDRGMVATPVSLKQYFDKDESLHDVGKAEYLSHLASMASTIINSLHYARIIYDLALQRKLIAIGEDMVNQAFEHDVQVSAKDQIEQAEQCLFNLASEGHSDSGFRHLNVSLKSAIDRADLAFKRKEKISGISTGFTDLDHYLGGLQDSDLLILAARPSMGKTALAINLALESARFLKKRAPDPSNPPGVGFFSLEMSAEQLATRLISVETTVNSSKMRVGNLTEHDFEKLVQATKSLQDLPIFIDDTPALSIAALRTRARRLKRKHNLGLLMIDYLQLVRGSSKMSESNRVQEVSEITQGLKAIAKELNIPVLALSQLSRAVEQRDDKRPQLSDLRESGSIEQDADVVMFIYREEYYVARKQPAEGSPKFGEWQDQMNQCKNQAEIIIAKQRNGPVGVAKLYFDSNSTRFGNLAEEDLVPYV
ncbi:MAG: replicative DNA helicase [Alphaproteobacteria bacterium]|nr:replicative DNA helicase [Alphaproteobacteria bacterium]